VNAGGFPFRYGPPPDDIGGGADASASLGTQSWGSIKSLLPIAIATKVFFDLIGVVLGAFDQLVSGVLVTTLVF
jgi:hypothetical protein